MAYFKSSDESWQEFYLNVEEAKYCHIKQHGIKMLSKNLDSFTAIWNSLTPTNDASRYLNEERIRKNHCHGISICQKLFHDTLLCVILTGSRNNDNFETLVIQNKKYLLKEATDILTLHHLIETI